jgi:hypothetical protein
MTVDATPPRVAEAWRKLSEKNSKAERAEWDADLDRLRDVLGAEPTIDGEPVDPPAS